MKYSVITPVYNRPDEVRELLESLSKQTVAAVAFKNFEVIIIEDGSTLKMRRSMQRFSTKIRLKIFLQTKFWTRIFS